MPAPLPLPSLPRFGWFRYRLRSLFVLTGLIAVAIHFGGPFATYRAEQRALETLRSCGTLVLEAPINIFL
jgi:hypothetical protein